MPLYDAKCPRCDAVEEYVSSIDERRERAPTCACGTKMEMVISPVMGRVMFPAAGCQAYISPVSGRVVDTASKRRDDLARTGCRPYEGFAQEKAESDRQMAYAEKKRDTKLHDDVSRAYYALSPSKRKVLNG